MLSLFNSLKKISSTWYGKAFLVLFLLMLIHRIQSLVAFMPYNGIDENDITEYAIGYLGGDWNPHWHGYGATYSYVVAIFLKIAALFTSGGINAQTQQYFEDPTLHYALTRLVSLISHLGMGIVSFLIAKRFVRREVAYFALFLGLFPFTDLLTGNFFISRIDSLMGLFQCLGIYQLILWVQRGKIKHGVIAAAFFGFGLATKPLPGLLALPALGLTWLYIFIQKINAFRNQKQVYLAKLEQASKKKRKQQKLIAPSFPLFFLGTGILLLALVVVGEVLFNPYSYLNFDSFWAEQVKNASEHGGRSFTKGYDITRFMKPLGFFYTIIGFASAIYAGIIAFQKRNFALALIPIFIFTVYLAFAKGAARNYFYIPIIPIMHVAILISLVYLSKTIKKQRKLVLPITYSLLVLFPSISIAGHLINFNTVNDKLHTSIAAKEFIEVNIDLKSSFLITGFYPYLPKIHSKNINHYGPFTNKQKRAYYGDYFMYNRWSSEYWRKNVHQFLEKKSKAQTGIYQNMEFSKGLNVDTRYLQYLKVKRPRYLMRTKEIKDSKYFDQFLIKSFTLDEFKYGPKIFIYDLTKKVTDNLDSKSFTDQVLNGLTYASKGKFAEAIQQYDRAILQNDKDALLFFMKGFALFKMQSYSDALTTFNKAATLEPKNADTHYNIGLCLRRLNQDAKAVDSFTKTLKLNKKYGNAYIQRAECYLKQKKRNEACADLAEAKRLKVRFNEAVVQQICGNVDIKTQPKQPVKSGTQVKK